MDNGTAFDSPVPKVVLFEDEQLKLTDSLARRIIYHPLPADGALYTSGRVPSKCMALNLTTEHFKPGATKFRDLKPEVFELCAIFFNALAFAFDKKRRLTTTLQEKKKTVARANQRKHQINAEAEQQQDGVTTAVQSEVVQQEKEDAFINGAQYVSVYVETLLATEAGGGAFRVEGFRLWVLDASNDKSGLDLVTKGVKETLIESANIQREVQTKLDLIASKTAASAKKAYNQKTFALKSRYSYTNTTTDEVLINQVNKYFAMDGLLAKQSTVEVAVAADDSAEPRTDEKRQFIDSRAFLTHNRINTTSGGGHSDFEPRLCERANTMHTFFGKEQAMVYHVERDNICVEQCALASYCGENSDDILDAVEERKMGRSDPERLRKMLCDNNRVKDSQFHQFPFPETTYQIDDAYLSFEVFAEMPLPHHMGTYLYTTHHRDTLAARLNQTTPTGATAKPKRDLFGMNVTRDTDVDASVARPLGMYESEYEVNPSLMHIYAHYLTQDMKSALAVNTTVPRHVRANFQALIESDIRKGLLAICTQVDRQKTYITDASNNRDGALENAPYLEVEPTDPGGALPFRATSVACRMHNRDKRHIIDRRVYSLVGGDPIALTKEKNKNLSTANTAYFRSILAEYRPVDATVENALACMGTSTYDKLFLERDIYLILDVLNRYGYANIDKKFFDPKTLQVRKGYMERYIVARRAFTEAIIVEFYDEFFTSSKVSLANLGIRNDLFGVRNGVSQPTKAHCGMPMPIAKFNMQTRPYHAYKLWVYSYFVEHDGINHNYKTSDILFHARYHHCRAYPPHSKDPKMNVLMSGQGTAGKSHKLGATKDACPSGVAEGITHMTNQAYNVDQNMNDMLVINEELSNKLIAPSTSKSGNGTSEAANDDARNNFKERATAGVTVTLAFYFDEETGERKARLSKCQCQNVILGATNNDLSDSDPNVMSRFIIISVPRSKNDVIGNRPQDKNKLEIGKDETKHTQMQEQVREVHRIYYMVECMVKSGILGNTLFGVAIDGAQIYMTRILDLVQAKYGIATNDIRKRKHVIEMARCKCISFAVWYGLTSPLTRSLQHDVYTGEFIGFNPRVLLDGIMPYLVVTKDHVIDAISSLSCLWGHEYMDKILENLATTMCNLDKLRESDFVLRPRSDLVGAGSNTTATSALTTRVDPNKKGAGKRGRATGGFGSANGGGGGGGGDEEEDDLVIDYNFIAVTSKSHADIHNLLSNSLGDLCVAPNDISKVLRDLSRTYIQTPGYKFVEADDNGDARLEKSDKAEHCIPRRIVDYGYSAVNGLPTIAISVAFLKQKLPYTLPDELIEDLTQYAFGQSTDDDDDDDEDTEKTATKTRPEETNAMTADAIDAVIMHDDEEDTMTLGSTLPPKARISRLMDAITIRSGGPNESSIIKAIKDVLENSVLEFDPTQDSTQEKANFIDYADVDTRTVPWFTYATSEHPQPLLIGAMFPDLKDAYSKVHGHNKEIILSDKVSMLQLQRRKNGAPLVYYNYNTVCSTAQSALSIFQVAEPEYPTLADGETDAYKILEVQELEAIRAENAKFADVHKNRFKMFADHPVFRIDRDLDLISCRDHLRSIGYPFRHREDRLVNYPPHMYMNLVDRRDKDPRSPPLVPLYGDIMERIETTRKIIEAQCGIFSPDTPQIGGLIDANFHLSDLRDSVYGNAMDVEPSEESRSTLKRRLFVYRSSERAQAHESLAAPNKRYAMYGQCEIVSGSHNIRTNRATKRVKKT